MKISLLIILVLLIGATPEIYAQHDLSDDAKQHYSLGHDYYKKGRYDEAIVEFKKAVEHDARDVASLFGLGNCYFLKQEFEQAISYYLSVTKLKPDFPKAHYALALAYRRLGNIAEAEKEFDLYNRLSTQAPQERRAEAPKPTVKKVEPKKEAEVKETPPERPTVKRLGPRREITTEAKEERPPVRRPVETEAARPERRAPTEPEKVLQRARPTERGERITTERSPTREETRPPVRVLTKRAKEEGNLVYRWVNSLWQAPLGKLFVLLLTYTLVTQVWIGIVVLTGLIVLWKRR